jgi:hypothetical protein
MIVSTSMDYFFTLKVTEGNAAVHSGSGQFHGICDERTFMRGNGLKSGLCLEIAPETARGFPARGG